MPLPCLEKEKWIHEGMAGFQSEIINMPNDVFYTVHFHPFKGIFKKKEKGKKGEGHGCCYDRMLTQHEQRSSSSQE